MGAEQTPVVLASGSIGNGTAAQLQAFLASSSGLARHPTILLSSPGGNVLGAMLLGRYMRLIGATSVVGTVREPGGPVGPDVCVASCVYAFLGGVHRVLPARSIVGIKRMRYDGQGSGHSTYGNVVASLRSYVRTMGITPRFADFCEQQPGDVLHVLAPAEIAEWGLAGSR